MVAQQLSRPALLYLLASFSLCNALLSIYLPWWLLLVAAVCLVWRLFIFSGRTSFPAAWLRVVLVVLSGAALLAQFGFVLSVDIFVALLLLGFSLKLLEIYQNKDAQFLLYLGICLDDCFFILAICWICRIGFLGGGLGSSVIGGGTK